MDMEAAAPLTLLQAIGIITRYKSGMPLQDAIKETDTWSADDRRAVRSVVPLTNAELDEQFPIGAMMQALASAKQDRERHTREAFELVDKYRERN